MSYPIVRLAGVKEGDTFYECERGQNVGMTALENARPVDVDEVYEIDGHKCRYQAHGHACRVRRHDNGSELELFEAHEPSAYGLRLYKAPVYG